MTASNFKPHFMNFTLGASPFRDIDEGCKVLADNFPEAILIPRFTRGLKSVLEGLPCVVLDSERRRLYFDISPEREAEVMQFYEKYEAGDTDYWAISPQESKGMYELLRVLKSRASKKLKLVIYSLPGPMTWGNMIFDKDGTPCLFNATLKDILIKHMEMKSAWAEKKIKQELPGVETAIQLGEPSLVLFTSAMGTGSREDIQGWFNAVFEKTQGLKGIHCCANADWTILMDASTSINVLHFDAYQFGEKFVLFADSVKKYLKRGGMVAWGIVPNSNDVLPTESVDSLEKKLSNIIEMMASKGIDKKLLAEKSFVSTCCDTSNMTQELAVKAYQMTRLLTERMRQKYPA